MIRALTARALAAARFAAIGRLAIGIIHEINNPIACLHSSVWLLLKRVPAVAELALQNGGNGKESRVFARELREALQEAAAAIEIVTSITRNLKSLAYFAHDEPKETDLHECIEAALRVAGHELKYRVRVEKEFGEIPKLVAYPGLLIQVFLNLFVNAAHAIEGEGVLSIRTRKEGSDAFVEVADTGRGIAPEHLSQVFRPFFTTRPIDEGLGLGLSICKGIIDRHGGEIRASSSPGKGTMIRIRLPLDARGGHDGR